MDSIAIDVGGANLKLADGRGYCAVRPFALWREPQNLAAALGELLSSAPPAEQLAVTMTGELADCFVTKAEGVDKILEAVQQASGGRRIAVYLVNGRFVSPHEARVEPLLAAASNWHALAAFAGRFAPRQGAVLVDIGSTTTDIIPLRDGVPTASGLTDPQRLVSGELVYTGVRRSPLCAVTSAVPWRSHQCPTAQELFATTWDAYLTLGDLQEEPECLQTADGRPATREMARDRLARSICADRTLFSPDDALEVARAVERNQLARLANAYRPVVNRLSAPLEMIILSGEGEFLGRRLMEKLRISVDVVSLGDQLGPEVSRVAPAHALAVLAAEAL